MATEKRLIDADALLGDDVWICGEFVGDPYDDGYVDALDAVQKVILEFPTVDAVEVVRCKDCKHFVADTKVGGKWISVKDGLPESGKDAVMIALRWGEVDIGWCEDEKWGSEFVNEYEDGEVTHWMPLPQPPKGE